MTLHENTRLVICAEHYTAKVLMKICDENYLLFHVVLLMYIYVPKYCRLARNKIHVLLYCLCINST